MRLWHAATAALAFVAVALRGKLRRRPWKFAGRKLMYSWRPKFETWVNHHAWNPPISELPWTPILTCEVAASSLIARFDWRVAPEGWTKKKDKECGLVEDFPWEPVPVAKDPSTVWVAPHALGRLFELAEAHFDPRRSDRVVVFLGHEMPLSHAFGRGAAEWNASVARLRKYFRRISFQTKDVPMEHVHAIPMGLCWAYMKNVLHTMTDEGHGYADFLRSVRGPPVPKTRQVLAAWGAVASWIDKPRTLARATRDHQMGRLYLPAHSLPRAVIASHHSRVNLKKWVDSYKFITAGVEHRNLGPIEWWVELPKYRFLLCPPGAGIQTSKALEALLVLTAPIMQWADFPLFPELVERGMPVVLVDKWSEVTKENVTRWWKHLGPRLESYRRNCLTADAWWRMYTGELERCE